MLSNQAILECLQNVLASAEFARAKRMSRFLSVVVEETVAGRTQDLKERQIGIEVFDQPADWDPKINNIVRGEARRLRSKLNNYYETVGRHDPIRISMPKGGYGAQFTEIRQAASPDLVDADQVSTPAAWHRAWSRGIAALALTVSLAVLVALFYLLPSRRAHAKVRDDNFEILPFANEIGQEFSPAVSPDGTRIAYVWDGNGSNYDIYIKDIQKGTLSRLTRDPSPDISPSWSPDGSRVAFLRVLSDHQQVILRSVAGTAEQVLTEVSSPIGSWAAADSNPYFGCYGPEWSPSGDQIVVSDQEKPGGRYDLYRVSVHGGRRTQLTHPVDEARDFCPRFSPDGRRIAFVRAVSHGIDELHVISAEGHEDSQITFDRHAIRGLNWTRDGQHIIFSSLHLGSFQLREISADGGESRLLPVASTSVVDPSPSPDGKWLAFTELEENWNIWRVRLLPHGLGEPEMLLSSSGKNYSPMYSADGRHIAFISDRSGSSEIWLSDENGHNLTRLTNLGTPWLGNVRWSPDGSTIAFDARTKEHSGIFTMQLTGGQPVPVVQDQFEERSPTWSHDGKSIYFNSWRGGNLQIWNLSRKSGELRPIGPANLNTATEFEDGHALYFGTNSSELWKSLPDGSNARKLPISPRPQPGLDWYVRHEGIYFASYQDEKPAIFFYSFASNSSTRIGYTERPFAPGTSSLVVSPDGKWILYAQMDHVSTDIRIRKAPGAPSLVPANISPDGIAR
jgi:Tol biopolymer transport system component